MNLYTIYDKLPAEGGPIFQAKNDAVAKRQFFALMSRESVLSISDYELICVGTFNTSTLEIEPCHRSLNLDLSEVVE